MLADLLLPRRCVACGRPGDPWCDACLPTGPALAIGGGPITVRAAGVYRGALRDAVLQYKERGRRDLAGALARLLAIAIRAVARPATARVLLVPVPSARRAAAARGGDHLARLAVRAAAGCGLRVARGGLRLTRAVADSSGLDVAARARNLAGAFDAVRAPPGGAEGWSVIVVDDVVTTGATLREAHRALTARGWVVLGAAVVAATPRVFPPGLRAARPIGTAQGSGLAWG